MKKTILSLAAVLMTSGLSMAQFTFLPNATTPTGLTFTGNAVPPSGATQGQFYNNQPNNNGGTMYSENTCTTPITQGSGAGQVGGFDGAIHDPSSGGNPNGITYFGGVLRNVYYGAPCAVNIPSWGFHTGTNTGTLAATGKDIDLSATANQQISFSYRTNVAISNIQLQLFDGAYNTKLNTVSVPITGDGAYHTFTYNFSSDVATGADMTNIRQVSLLYNSDVFSPGAMGFSLATIKLGSALVTSIENSTSVTSANLFPNPTTGITTITGELKAVSDVRIVLVDMLGQEVKVIAQERTNSINNSFDVSSLNKGIYSVVYYIDGAPAKSQKLVVR